jgi:hypothetical protein
MEHSIQDYITSKIRRYEKVIANEELFQKTNGQQGAHCLNVSQLKERMETWTEDDWLKHLENSTGEYYEVNYETKTYKLVQMPGGFM